MEEKRSAREETRRLKRIIVVVLCCMVAFIVLYLVLSNVIASNKKDDGEDNFVGRKYTIIYHDTVADNDVMKDPDYLGLNRGIWYYNTLPTGRGLHWRTGPKGITVSRWNYCMTICIQSLQGMRKPTIRISAIITLPRTAMNRRSIFISRSYTETEESGSARCSVPSGKRMKTEKSIRSMIIP